MYYYLIDTFLREPKHEKQLDRIKARLLDLDISGKRERLTMLKNEDELVRDEVKKGVSTVVIVGNDESFLKMVEPTLKYNVVLGYVPIGKGNVLAEAMGLPEAEKACDVIAARNIRRFDIGRAGNKYFFRDLLIKENLPRLKIKLSGYKITPGQTAKELKIINFDADKNGEKKQSGELELMIKAEKFKKIWFFKKKKLVVDEKMTAQNFTIKGFEYIKAILDGHKILKTPLEVSLEKDRFPVIVNRKVK